MWSSTRVLRQYTNSEMKRITITVREAKLIVAPV